MEIFYVLLEHSLTLTPQCSALHSPSSWTVSWTVSCTVAVNFLSGRSQ